MNLLKNQVQLKRVKMKKRNEKTLILDSFRKSELNIIKLNQRIIKK